MITTDLAPRPVRLTCPRASPATRHLRHSERVKRDGYQSKSKQRLREGGAAKVALAISIRAAPLQQKIGCRTSWTRTGMGIKYCMRYVNSPKWMISEERKKSWGWCSAPLAGVIAEATTSGARPAWYAASGESSSCPPMRRRVDAARVMHSRDVCHCAYSASARFSLCGGAGLALEGCPLITPGGVGVKESSRSDLAKAFPLAPRLAKCERPRKPLHYRRGVATPYSRRADTLDLNDCHKRHIAYTITDSRT